METSAEYHFFESHKLLLHLIAGGCSGLAVDTFLFPIDTCKTRLQSERGFWKAGGFHGIYNGILPVIAASIPIASTFFLIYSTVNEILPQIVNFFFINSFIYVENELVPNTNSIGWKFFIRVLVNSVAASCGEICAGIIRVPIEIVKQKRQVSKMQYRAIDILMQAYRSEGLWKGIYRGYLITIMRDIPFSMIQYPLWEALEILTQANVFVGALNGSIAGAVASGATTPLDVAKTRIQLADIEENAECNPQNRNPIYIWRMLYLQNGIPGIFGGFVPRVAWTTVGGFIWFGAYKLVQNLLLKL